MPTTKTWQIRDKDYLRNAVKYILKDEKTRGGTLTSGYHIQNVQSADFEMLLTRDLAISINGQKSKSKNEIFAFHMEQSFSPEEQLTPEEIHEIGRQTILELTEGKYEFIIATHVDKAHIHNHIIFNATSSFDLKKFRWQKGTPELLRNISDKVADYHQAMTLPPLQRTSYTKYKKYLAMDPLRPEIKKRLNFLLRNSQDVDDFLKKAKILDVEIDFSGKYATYKLLDKEQKKAVRDSSLDKRATKKNDPSKYSLEKIKIRLEKNELVFPAEDIKAEYEQLNQWIDQNPDLTLEIEPWQVDKISNTGIYVHVKVAGQYGLVKIPSVKFDEKENGNFELHVKQAEKFFFIDDKKSQQSKKIYGSTLIKQLSKDVQREPIRRNRAMENLQYLANAWAFLETHQIAGDEAFEHLGESFVEDMEKVEAALRQLDQKIIAVHEQVKFEENPKSKLAFVQTLQIERDELQEAYQDLLKQMQVFEEIRELTDEKIQDKGRSL